MTDYNMLFLKNEIRCKIDSIIMHCSIINSQELLNKEYKELDILFSLNSEEVEAIKSHSKLYYLYLIRGGYGVNGDLAADGLEYIAKKTAIKVYKNIINIAIEDIMAADDYAHKMSKLFKLNEEKEKEIRDYIKDIIDNRLKIKE
jgi:hypothetical protein